MLSMIFNSLFALGLVESCRGFPFRHYLASFARIHTHTHGWNFYSMVVVVLVVVALFQFTTPPSSVLCDCGTSCESWSLQAFRRFVLTQLSSAIQRGRLCSRFASLSLPLRTTSRRVFRFRFRLSSHCYIGSVFFFNPSIVSNFSPKLLSSLASFLSLFFVFSFLLVSYKVLMLFL